MLPVPQGRGAGGRGGGVGGGGGGNNPLQNPMLIQAWGQVMSKRAITTITTSNKFHLPINSSAWAVSVAVRGLLFGGVEALA